MVFTAEATDYDVLDVGTYQAEYVKVTPSEVDGPFGPFLDWEFSALNPATMATAKVTGRSSTSFGPDTKAREWAEGVLGRQLAKGERLDFDTLVGRPCQLVLEIVEKTKGSFNRIATVLPASAPPAAAPVDALETLEALDFLAWKAAQAASAAPAKRREIAPDELPPAPTASPSADDLVVDF